jgi:hypothetical protein
MFAQVLDPQYRNFVEPKQFCRRDAAMPGDYAIVLVD